MHEEAHAHCADCMHFVLVSRAEGALADWGYCLKKTGGVELPRQQLQEIEKEAQQGNLQRLRAGELGLFEALDHGCEDFEHFFPF